MSLREGGVGKQPPGLITRLRIFIRRANERKDYICIFTEKGRECLIMEFKIAMCERQE